MGRWLVVPEAMIAIHNLLGWKCDAAALHHENGVSAVYGLGYQQPFHSYGDAGQSLHTPV